MPYLLLVALRCQQRTINTWAAVIIGIIAAIGFAQKPFFLPAWLVLELYLMVKTKNLLAWWRTETIACLSVFLIYGVSILLFTPQYITQLVPFIKPIYYSVYRLPFSMMLINPIFIFGLALLISYCFSRKYVYYYHLSDLLALSTGSMMLVYLSQGTLWYYHILPMLMTSSLLLAILTAGFFQKNNLFSYTQLNWRLAKTAICSFYLTAFWFMLALIIGSYNNAGLQFMALFLKSPLYQTAKTVPGQPIYIFTDDIAHNYPLIDYTKTYSDSRFPCLWPLLATNRLARHHPTPAQQKLANKINAFVRSNEINMLLHEQPVFVFVHIKDNYWLTKNLWGLRYKYKLVNR
jgi:hypothetical protein